MLSTVAQWQKKHWSLHKTALHINRFLQTLEFLNFKNDKEKKKSVSPSFVPDLYGAKDFELQGSGSLIQIF